MNMSESAAGNSGDKTASLVDTAASLAETATVAVEEDQGVQEGELLQTQSWSMPYLEVGLLPPPPPASPQPSSPLPHPSSPAC